MGFKPLIYLKLKTTKATKSKQKTSKNPWLGDIKKVNLIKRRRTVIGSTVAHTLKFML